MTTTDKLRKTVAAAPDSAIRTAMNDTLVTTWHFLQANNTGRIGLDLMLAMLFLKWVSDTWEDQLIIYNTQYPDQPELVAELMTSERFVRPEAASFHALWERRYEPGNGERIDQALRTIEDANSTRLKSAGRGVFQGISFNTSVLGEEKPKNVLLRQLLEDFARPELDLKPSRFENAALLGDACEHVMGLFAASYGQQTGEFYTPSEVGDLMVELLNPQPGDSICDPACGTGSLLIKCGRKIIGNYGKKNYALYGQEVLDFAWSLAKIKMFLYGENNHKIALGDTLRSPKLLDDNGGLQVFDIVIANPPFGLKNWGHELAERDVFERFCRGVPPKTKGDFAFILHMIETLKAGSGRMAVVVPLGVLFRGSVEAKIRQQLIDENLLDAVIGLPEKLFYGTGIAAAILIFKKNKPNDSVMFIDASQEFIAAKNRNVLSDVNIHTIAATYRAGRSVSDFAYVANLDDIKKNDYNLNVSRYVDTVNEEKEIDLMAIRAERAQLSTHLARVETEMAAIFKTLGYPE